MAKILFFFIRYFCNNIKYYNNCFLKMENKNYYLVYLLFKRIQIDLFLTKSFNNTFDLFLLF